MLLGLLECTRPGPHCTRKAPLPVCVSCSHPGPEASTWALCPTETLVKTSQEKDSVPGAGGCSPKTHCLLFPPFLTQNSKWYKVPEAGSPKFIGCKCAWNPGLYSAGLPQLRFCLETLPISFLTKSWAQCLWAWTDTGNTPEPGSPTRRPRALGPVWMAFHPPC